MSLSTHTGNLLLGLYSGIRKSHVLETSQGRWLFARSYHLYKRYLEDPFHSLIGKHPELFQGGHVLDIGANIGYTSALFASAVDPAYRVFSFEPEEVNFSFLEECAGRPEACGRIVPVRSAVGFKDGIIPLWRNQHHPGDHRILTGPLQRKVAPSACVSVPITTIDSFVCGNPQLQRISFIKIDVQGYELAVCQGMEQTLASHPAAVIALEYCPDAMYQLGFDPHEMLTWWKTRGYTVSAFCRNGTITTGLPTKLGKAGYLDLLFARNASGVRAVARSSGLRSAQTWASGAATGLASCQPASKNEIELPA